MNKDKAKGERSGEGGRGNRKQKEGASQRKNREEGKKRGETRMVLIDKHERRAFPRTLPLKFHSKPGRYCGFTLGGPGGLTETNENPS